MALPWLRILDLLMTVTDVARKVSRSSAVAALNRADEPEGRLAARAGGANAESHLATVMVAALKEAFTRDRQREEIERERLEAERRRAERLLKLDLARQAGEREIARLRLLGGMAAGTVLTTLVAASVVGPGGTGARVALAVGWSCLLAAVATSFIGQSRVEAAMVGFGERHGEPQSPSPNGAGASTLWLTLAGLAALAVGIVVR